MNQKTFGVKIEAITDGFKNKMEEIKSLASNTSNSVKEKLTGFVIKEKGELQEVGKILKTAKSNIIPKKTEPIIDTKSTIVRIAELKSIINTLKKELRDIEPGTEAFKTYTIEIDNAEKELKQLIQTQKQLSINSAQTGNSSNNSIKNVSNGFKTASKGVSKFGNVLKGIGILSIFSAIRNGISKSLNSIKKFNLATLGIRSTIMGLRKAVSSYLSYDSKLSTQLNDTWSALGAQLAPVIEYIINLFSKAVSYINLFVTALTGINMVARANAKALNSQAKASKNASKSLTALDEITNIQKDSGSGVNQIQLPNTNMNDFIKNLADKIKSGDWYGAGVDIGNQINRMLDNIDWTSIHNKALKYGKGIAQFFNGGIKTTNWEKLGSTIANGINTAIIFGFNFIETFNWVSAGKSLGKTLKGFFNTIDWEKLFVGTVDLAIGIFNFVSSAIEEVDWGEIATKIIRALMKADWLGLITSFCKMIGTMIQTSLSTQLSYSITIGEEMGRKLGDKIVKGIKSMATSLSNAGKDGGKSIINGIISMLNIGINKINKLLTISVSNSLAGLLKKLGVNISKGSYRLFSIPTIPQLNVGTNYVPEDQMAYIHKGEAVIPKKFNSAEYFNNINNNQETNALLLDLNRTMNELLEKDTNLYINGKEFAQATYKDFKNEGNRLGTSNIVNVR